MQISSEWNAFAPISNYHGNGEEPMKDKICLLTATSFLSFMIACGTAPEKIGVSKVKDAPDSRDSTTFPYETQSDAKTADAEAADQDTVIKTGTPTAETVTPDPSSDTATTVPKPTDCKSFSWETIKKPEEATCFTSTQSAFAAVPDFIKPFWILMRNSRSAQKSTLEKPRALIVSPDGSFIIGAATDPNARGDLEVAVFDYEKSEWQFAGIDYSTTPPTVEKELCKSCHGKDIQHPIWTQSGSWTGAFAAKNLLQEDESNFIKRVIAKSGDTPELLKNLKFNAASKYDAGRRLAPATKYYGGEENGQVLNYVSMQKAAQATTARIFRDSAIKLSDILAMSSELSCKTGSGTLKKFGYSVAKDLSFALEGVDRSGDMFNGRFRASDYLAAELLGRALIKDPSLKEKLPAAAKAFADPRYKYFTTKSAAEHNAFMASTRTSIRSLMSDYLNRVIGDAIRSSEHCAAIKSLASK